MLRKILKKLSKVTVAAGVAMAILTSVAGATSVKDYPRVAVMNFGNKAITSKGLKDHDFAMATEYAIYQLSASGWFDLIDYESLNTIAQMHNISNSGLVDPATIIAMGQFAGAEYMIVGNVTGLTLKENDTIIQGGPAKAGVGEHVVNASVAVRIVDIKTGRIMGAGIGKGSSTSTRTEIGFIEKKLVERAANRSITNTIAEAVIDEYARNRSNNRESERNSNSDSSHMDYNNTTVASGNENSSSSYNAKGSAQNGKRQESYYDNQRSKENSSYEDSLVNSETANSSNSTSNSSDYRTNSYNEDVYQKINTDIVHTDDTNYNYVEEQMNFGITIGTKQVSEVQVLNAISKAIRDAFYGKMGLLTTLNDGKPLNIKTGF